MLCSFSIAHEYFNELNWTTCVYAGEGSSSTEDVSHSDSSSEGRLTASKVILIIVAAVVAILINTLGEEKVCVSLLMRPYYIQEVVIVL